MLSDYCLYGWYGVVHDANSFQDSLSEWMKDKPLSILQLDPADRAVLRIAAVCVCLIFVVTHYMTSVWENVPMNVQSMIDLLSQSTVNDLHLESKHSNEDD
ncbi:hypothetical protein CDAR_274211 [Caerostris darwini]|uniref:Uncharacterized protein n=1 Tax=Caerostris darwini TaxID=1538125 RepID=A0AAV4RF87_9ARAC|nr:hypothetical protein CDAR_274211 [Caerostris darwini]